MNEDLGLRDASEYFVDIEGYPGYQVSNLGTVRSLDRKKLRKNGRTLALKGQQLKPQKNHKGYLRVRLRNEGEEKALLVHRLVAIAFIANPENKPQVNHLNGIKQDNNVLNLGWCTPSENIEHAFRMGLNHDGENHPNSILSHSQVLTIKQILSQGKFTLTDIAKKFNVGLTTIHDIKTGKQWKKV